MPGVLPTAIRDETATITAKSNEANDALTRLFYTLMERREEAERNRRMREREHELRRQERQEDRGASQEFWREQFRMGEEAKTKHFERSGAYDPKNRGQETRTSPLSPGTSGATVGGTNAPPIPPAPRTIPGSVAPVGDTTQFKTSQADTDDAELPAGARPTSYSGGEVDDDTTTELSARQSSQGRPNVSASRIPRAPTASPRSGTGGSRGQQGQTKTLFPPIRDEIKQAWASYEQKYNLPRGILQTAMGLTNENGYNARQQPRPHDGMGGWFGTTAELRKEMNIPDGDIVDPVRMGEHAARNMRRNIDAYLKFAGQTSGEKGSAPGAKLPAIGNKVEDVPKILMLTQLGPVAGPRALATLHLNPNAPLTRVLPPSRDSDGTEQDNARALIRSGIPSNQTVGGFYKDMVKSKVDPLHTETVQGQEGMLNQQPADQEVAPPRPSQDVPTSDANRFLQSRGGNVTNLDNEFGSRLAHAIQVAEKATGSQARINSLQRTPEKQAQLRANYIRAPVTYGGVTYRPNAAGGLAAPPGRSRHQGGIAGDVARGPVLDYLHAHPEVMRSVGLEFLPGHAGRVDPVHIQLARGNRPPLPATAPSSEVAAAPAPAQAPAQTAAVAPQPARKPSVYGAVSTFDAPVSPPIMTAQGVTSEPTASRLATNVPLPTPRPQTQTAAIPDDMSAAAAQPTPQTTQPVTQVTQATPQSQAADEAGMVGIENYTGPEAVPGQAVNNIIQSIQQKAQDYKQFHTGRIESGRLEQVWDYSQQPPAPTAPQGDTTNFLDPTKMREMQEQLLQARIAASQQPPPVAPPTPSPGAPIASKPIDPAMYKEQLQAMIAATGEGMPPVQGGWMPMPGGSSAAAQAKIVDKGPKAIRTVPMTGGGQPLYPDVPPLEPELTTRPKRAGSTAATPMPGGVTFGSGNVMPPPPGGKVYRVDPNNPDRVIVVSPGGDTQQAGQATVDPMLEVTDEEQ